MHTLKNYLRKNCSDQTTAEIIIALATASKYINAEIRMKDTDKVLAVNKTDDVQSQLDVVSDGIVMEHLKETKLVQGIASEEQEDVVTVHDTSEEYFVAYDPYDGGSVGDVNITFGSIFGIWSHDPMGEAVGKSLVASCYTLYGPRVTFMTTIEDCKAALFELNEVGEFILVRDDFHITEEAKHFAPGNLKATIANEKYRAIVEGWIASGKKLRYTGALVTDINHIIMKGDGIFTYPADTDYPDGRLRLLYEGAPLTHILTCIGGTGYTDAQTKLLDVELGDYHQRAPFYMGSQDDVKAAVEQML